MCSTRVGARWAGGARPGGAPVGRALAAAAGAVVFSLPRAEVRFRPSTAVLGGGAEGVRGSILFRQYRRPRLDMSRSGSVRSSHDRGAAGPDGLPVHAARAMWTSILVRARELKLHSGRERGMPSPRRQAERCANRRRPPVRSSSCRVCSSDDDATRGGSAGIMSRCAPSRRKERMRRSRHFAELSCSRTSGGRRPST